MGVTSGWCLGAEGAVRIRESRLIATTMVVFLVLCRNLVHITNNKQNTQNECQPRLALNKSASHHWLR